MTLETAAIIIGTIIGLFIGFSSWAYMYGKRVGRREVVKAWMERDRIKAELERELLERTENHGKEQAES